MAIVEMHRVSSHCMQLNPTASSLKPSSKGHNPLGVACLPDVLLCGVSGGANFHSEISVGCRARGADIFGSRPAFTSDV